MVYSDVEWDSTTATDTTISNGTITGAGSCSNYTSNCRSVYALNHGNNESIEITVNSSDASNRFVAGLGKDPYSSSSLYDAVEYAWHWSHSASQWHINESGTQVGSYSGNITDTVRISRNGDYIKYYVKDP